MILSMEKTLNSAWFSRRQQAKDNYCTLSTGQYWDLLTYVDVSSGLMLVTTSANAFLDFDSRMTISLSGKWSK